MLRIALGFLLGCWLTHTGNALLPVSDLLCASVLAVLILQFAGPNAVVGVLAGVVWAGASALYFAPAEIVNLNRHQTYLADVDVISMPMNRGGKVRFVGEVSKLNGQSGRWRLRISWRTTHGLQAGDRWQLPLRIRQASSYHNPGSWDYVGWLYARGIRYTAYVKPGQARRLASGVCCWLARQREAVRERLTQIVPAGEGRAMLLALALGDRSELTARQKALLAQTGTSHLVAISGLHVGLVGGLVGLLVTGLWRRIAFLCRHTPAIIAGMFAGLIAAVGYALLSGFGLPVQRAMVMLLVAGMALWRRKDADPWQLWGMALIAVLLFDPLAAQAAGLWLSFAAVAAILLTLPMVQGRTWVIQAMAMQLAIALALYPVLLAFHMPPAPWGPLVNFVLVPIYGIALLPLTLISTLLAMTADWAIPVVNWVAQLHSLVMQGLAATDRHLPEFSSGSWHFGQWLLLAGATLWLLLPAWPGKPAAFALWSLAQVPLVTPLAEGELDMLLLDVGQGLSVLIRTRDHALLFDTGAAYPSGFNLAEAVVLPALRYEGVNSLDTLILSHADNDHAGGVSQMQQGVPIGKIIAGEPTLKHDKLCDGQSWVWNRVHFALAPHLGYAEGNNASCILIVAHSAGNLVISGDAELAAERRHVPWVVKQGPVSVVVAGHHGSLTSSSPEWVAATQPDYVLYAVGQGNRWGFPKPAVRERWAEAGAIGMATDSAGAIRFVWKSGGRLQGPEQWRVHRLRHWHHAIR